MSLVDDAVRWCGWKNVCASLDHRERTSAQTEANAFGSEISAVASAAVDLTVGTIIEVRRVERFSAFDARETPLVPDTILADHLLGGENGESTTQAARSVGRLGTSERTSIGAAVQIKIHGG